MDDILAGDQGVLLLNWRQKWRGLQRGLLDLNHTLSTPRSLSQHNRAPDIWHSQAATPTTWGQCCPKASRLQVPSSPQQEMGKRQNNN